MTENFSDHYNQLLYSMYIANIKMKDQLGQTEDNLRVMALRYQQTEDANRRSVFDVRIPLSQRSQA
jgi:hypothetical protein